MALVPGLQQVREIGTGKNLIVHEILGKFLHVSRELVEIHQPVVVEVRDDHVFRVPRYINYLVRFNASLRDLDE